MTNNPFTYDFGKALQMLLNQAYAGHLTKVQFVSMMKSALDQAALRAWQAASHQPHYTGSMAMPAALKTALASQKGFVQGFAAAVFEAAALPASQSAGKRSQLAVRALMWQASVRNFSAQAEAEVSPFVLVRWRVGPTEHCTTCKWLDGQVHPRKWFADRGYWPHRPGTSALECGGWLCQCYFESLTVPTPSVATKAVMREAIGTALEFVVAAFKAGTFDPSKHPRAGKGSPKGGEFAKKYLSDDGTEIDLSAIHHDPVEQVDGNPILYHGTTSAVIKKIYSEGLLPHPAHGFTGNDELDAPINGVFLSSNPETAAYFADFKFGDVGTPEDAASGKVRAMLLKVRLPKRQRLKKDILVNDGWYTPDRISPYAIIGIEDLVWDGNHWNRGTGKKEAASDFYTVVFVRVPDAAEKAFDPSKHPHKPKGDPHGGEFAPKSGGKVAGVPEYIHHSYFEPMGDYSERGRFGYDPRTTPAAMLKRPNAEYGDHMMLLYLDPKAKYFEAKDQVDAIRMLKGEAAGRQAGNALAEEGDSVYPALDAEIARLLRRRGYRLVHYTGDGTPGDISGEWAVLHPKAIIGVQRGKGEKAFDPAKHPRAGKGSPKGGEFAPKTGKQRPDVQAFWDWTYASEAMNAALRGESMPSHDGGGYAIDAHRATELSAEAHLLADLAAHSRTRYQTLYRGESFDNEDDIWRKYSGNEYVPDGLVSTAVKQDIARTYSHTTDEFAPGLTHVVIKFVDPRGIRGVETRPFDDDLGSYEVILPPKQTWSIVDRHYDDKLDEWQIRMIPANLRLKAFDPAKHPHKPKGDPTGGEFAPKGTPSTPASTDEAKPAPAQTPEVSTASPTQPVGERLIDPDAEEMLAHPETHRRLVSMEGDNESAIQKYIKKYHANPANYQDGVYYRTEGLGAGAGVGKGMYLGQDVRAINNFYNLDKDLEVAEYHGQPKFLNLMDYQTYNGFEQGAKKRYGADKDYMREAALDMGYDGIRYYDPEATGEEFVLYNTAGMKKARVVHKAKAGAVDVRDLKAGAPKAAAAAKPKAVDPQWAKENDAFEKSLLAKGWKYDANGTLVAPTTVRRKELAVLVGESWRAALKTLDDHGHEHAPAGSPAGGQFVSKGEAETGKPLVVDAYRVGPTDNNRARGIFFSDEAKTAQDYAGLHGRAPVQGYRLSLKNPVVAPNARDLYIQWFGKEGRSFAEAPQYGFGDDLPESVLTRGVLDNAKWQVEIDRRLQEKALSLGHDGIVYTKPMLPAKREYAIFDAKVATPLASKPAPAALLADTHPIWQLEYGKQSPVVSEMTDDDARAYLAAIKAKPLGAEERETRRLSLALYAQDPQVRRQAIAQMHVEAGKKPIWDLMGHSLEDKLDPTSDTYVNNFLVSHWALGNGGGVGTQMQIIGSQIGPNAGLPFATKLHEGIKPHRPDPLAVQKMNEFYQQTQPKLPEMVHLYRGVGDKNPNYPTENPLLSFSSSKAEARKFAKQYGDGKRASGSIIEEDVPRQFILGSWDTIPNWPEDIVKGKKEYIVLGPAFAAYKKAQAALRSTSEKEFDSSKHPHRPKGDPRGGQFAPKGAPAGVAVAPAAVAPAVPAVPAWEGRGQFDQPSPVEKEIATLPLERGIVLNADGSKALDKQGAEHETEFTDDEAAAMAGKTLVHNHPGGRSFSRGDIEFALLYHLGEIRAVTKDKVYTMQFPRTAKPWGENDMHIRRPDGVEGEGGRWQDTWDYNDANDAAGRVYDKKVYQEAMDPHEASVGFANMIWQLWAAKKGFRYSVRPL